MQRKQPQKILITGKNSFIGTSLEKWLQQWPDDYLVDTIDMFGDEWRKTSFSGYQVVFHVAGIAHVANNPKLKNLYYQVNRDLALETAGKAKTDGVNQFIFMSSIIVYGDRSRINCEKVITRDTIPHPSNFYGESKLQTEEGLRALESNHFKVVILRSPLVYGKGSKGNYAKLAEIAPKLPLFPDIDNQLSMLYIDNLSEFIRLMINNKESGLFLPQNREYVKTSEMVKLIAEAHGKRIHLTKAFNPLLRVLVRRLVFLNKVFGSLVYEKSLSDYKENYQVKDFKQSIERVEK